jgi:hypothetical protein
MAKSPSSLRISDDLKLELRKIGGELTAEDGKEHSFEDVIRYLVKQHRKR